MRESQEKFQIRKKSQEINEEIRTEEEQPKICFQNGEMAIAKEIEERMDKN